MAFAAAPVFAAESPMLAELVAKGELPSMRRIIVYQCRQLGERVVPDEILAAMVLVTAATAIVCPLVLRPLLKRRVQA